MRRLSNTTLGVAIAVLLFSSFAALRGLGAEDGNRPNVVVILADDMGYGDPGCYNQESKIPTPHIDRLAAEGLRFTDAHAPGAWCVPTRYGLLTGRYPFRTSLDWNRRGVIDPNHTTIASLLGQVGYRTAMIGKWHLGFDGGPKYDFANPLRGGPVDRGFARYFGIPASLDIPPYYFIRDDHAVAPPTAQVAASNSPDVSPIQGAFWRAGGIAPGFRHIDVLPRLADEAVATITGHARQSDGRPLMLYMALPAPHTPWLPTGPYRGRSRAGQYGDFVVQVDDVVGRILTALRQAGMHNDTLVVFSSDNGPVWYEADVRRWGHRSVGPLRGMKGDAWEGGHRMPLVCRWPASISPGRASDQLVCLTDLMATLADITGQRLADDAGEDSFSLLPLLLDKPIDGPVRPAVVVKSSSGVLALRRGPWKLIPRLGSGGFSRPRREQPTDDGPRGQLYHLGDDLAETNNLWAERPEVVRELETLLAQIQREGRTRGRATP